MVALLDVNVLVALPWPSHPHHTPAHAWFARRRVGGWATCAITESGLLRVSSNQRAIADAVSPMDAAEVLRAMTTRAGHTFRPDDVRLLDQPAPTLARLSGHQQVTDAHLSGLAARHGGVLATFDTRLRHAAMPGARIDVISPLV